MTLREKLIVDSQGRFDYDFAVVQVLDKSRPDELPPTIHASTRRRTTRGDSKVTTDRHDPRRGGRDLGEVSPVGITRGGTGATRAC
jgi:hypothetical protein